MQFKKGLNIGFQNKEVELKKDLEQFIKEIQSGLKLNEDQVINNIKFLEAIEFHLLVAEEINYPIPDSYRKIVKGFTTRSLQKNINNRTPDIDVLTSLLSIAKSTNLELEVNYEKIIQEVTSKFDKDRNLFIINDGNIVENIYALRLLFSLGYKFDEDIIPSSIMDEFKHHRGGYKYTTDTDDIPSIIPTFLGLEMLLEIGHLNSSLGFN